MRKTESETLFEAFCERHGLKWSPIDTGPDRTPDYRLTFGSSAVIVEVKQIESEEGFEPHGCHSRIVGQHVRRKIEEARKQLQPMSHDGVPTILLIYNSIDPMQLFGTEAHDFICAMYGELTVRFRNGRIENSYHGRNSLLRKGINTSFSAIGHLRSCENEAKVHVFENVFARNKLPFDVLPQCIDVVRVELESEA